MNLISFGNRVISEVRSFDTHLPIHPDTQDKLKRLIRLIEKVSSKITTIICLESEPLQKPLPSLDLSRRRSNLSRALSP